MSPLTFRGIPQKLLPFTQQKKSAKMDRNPSELRKRMYEVPQGSVREPLIFIIYINVFQVTLESSILLMKRSLLIILQIYLVSKAAEDWFSEKFVCQLNEDKM